MEICDSANTTTPETPWGSNRWKATSMTVALAAFAAPIIMSRTASTSVRTSGSHPDSSQTIWVPSAFNLWSLLVPLGGSHLRTSSAGACCAVHVPDLSTSSCRRVSVHGRLVAMARRARLPYDRRPTILQVPRNHTPHGPACKGAEKSGECTRAVHAESSVTRRRSISRRSIR